MSVHSKDCLPSKEEKHDYVHSMFESIAARYDLLNDLMTGGMHRLWKKQICKNLKLKPSATVADLCCGTGDLTSMLASFYPDSKILGFDFSAEMLNVAKQNREKSNIKFKQADILQLPLEKETVDAVTISFGLRNVTNYQKALEEANRVCKKGGQIVILDLSHPQGFWGVASHWYRFFIVPSFGKLIAKNKAAYNYLPNSIQNYPDQKNLCEILEAAGWDDVNYKNIFGGVVAIHTARKSN